MHKGKAKRCAMYLIVGLVFWLAPNNNAWGSSDAGELFKAAQAGDAKAVAAALDRGIPVNAADAEGNTALMVAASAGRTDVVKLLLQRGAQPDAPNKQGKTALMMAAVQGHVAVLQAMKAHMEHAETSVVSVPTTPHPHQKLDRLLISAAGAGDLSQVKTLLDQGANLEGGGKDFGATPLMWAAMGGYAEVVTYLLDRGAKIDAQDKDGRTALMWAASQGHTPVVKLLLSRGADPAIVDKAGVSALAAASAQGHSETMQLLKRVLGHQAPEAKRSTTPRPRARLPEAGRPASRSETATGETPTATSDVPSVGGYTPPIGHAGR